MLGDLYACSQLNEDFATFFMGHVHYKLDEIIDEWNRSLKPRSIEEKLYQRKVARQEIVEHIKLKFEERKKTFCGMFASDMEQKVRIEISRLRNHYFGIGLKNGSIYFTRYSALLLVTSPLLLTSSSKQIKKIFMGLIEKVIALIQQQMHDFKRQQKDGSEIRVIPEYCHMSRC